MSPKPKFLLLAIILLLLLVAFSFALAQTDSTDWSDPINLSRSGAASDPHILTDHQGTVHALWYDSYDGFTYSRYLDGAWSSASPLFTPIDPEYRNLKFVSAPDGYVHLIWIDAENSLYYARVTNARINSPQAWSSSQLLALSAASADLAASPDGSVHISYLRNEPAADFPAGIYTLSKRSAIGEWLISSALYTSPYFRGLDPSLAQVSLAAGASGLVLASWVDPALEQLYLARSADGGRTWDEPVLMDSRQETDGFSARGPAYPVLSYLADRTLLLWSAGHQGSTCSLYFSLGDTTAESWSDLSLLPEPFQRTCPESLQVLPDEGGIAWLFAAASGGVYTLAFDPSNESGSYWSAPQLQSDLTTFTSPQTFRQVQLTNHQAALSQGLLHVVGLQLLAADSPSADPDASPAADVWQRSLLLADPASYFPTPTPTPLWSTPASLVEFEGSLNSPLLLAESPARQHALWTQQGDSAIYYAFFDGSRWTQPLSVLFSPGGEPGVPSAVLTASGHIFLAWADAGDNAIYYSHVPALAALDSGEWTVPQELVLGEVSAASPSVQLGSGDRIYIAYAVPLNEGRGIYLLNSTAPIQPEGRLAWSQPVLVFDAAAAAWGMLDHPRLALDAEDIPHLLWTRYSLPPNALPLGLYYADLSAYASSQDTDPTLESPLSASQPALPAISAPLELEQGQVDWSQLIYSPGGALHIAWQLRTLAGDRVLWHSYSLDGGRTWSEPVRPAGFQASDGPVALVLDTDGNLHLTQIVPTFNGPLTLQRWQWQGGASWVSAESQPLPDLLSAADLVLASAGEALSSLYTALKSPQTTPEAGETPETLSALYFSSRPLSLSGATPTPQPTFTPAPESTLAPGSELPISSPSAPTATLSLSADSPGGPLAGLFNNRWGGIALAAIPALIIVAAAFIFAARKLMNRN